MSKDFTARVLALSSIYGSYFASDFSGLVMGHLQSSFPLAADQRDQVVADQLTAQGPIQVKEGNDSAPARFVYECAEFALDNQMADPESRDTYNAIKQLDSLHHDAIQQIAYHSASLYQNTLDGAALSVVTADAGKAMSQIQQLGESRLVASQSGARVHTFLWGLLSDGMWLNTTMQKAYDTHRLFRPGHDLTSLHATAAFEAARAVHQDVSLVNLDRDTIAQHYAVLSAQISDSAPTMSAPLGTPPSVFELAFVPGTLRIMMEHWEKGLSDSKKMVEAVSQMSFFIAGIDQLLAAGKGLDDVVDPAMAQRLTAVSDALSLCLVGFEALRETKFKDTLIFFVNGEGEDPTVDVMINGDTVRSYQQEGGLDTDLSQLALYLDPRRGQVISGFGHSVQWALARRDEIVPEILAMESLRTERLHRHDALSIASDVTQVVSDLCQGYMAAAGVDQVPQPIMVKIRQLANQVTARTPTADLNLEAEIAMILADATQQPFIAQVTKTFVHTALTHPGSDTRSLTVATLAAADAVAMLNGSHQ